MKLANHCQLKFARTILVLASEDLSKYKISNKLQIAKGKMQKCCGHCANKTSKLNRSQPWKNP